MEVRLIVEWTVRCSVVCEGCCQQSIVRPYAMRRLMITTDLLFANSINVNHTEIVVANNKL